MATIPFANQKASRGVAFGIDLQQASLRYSLKPDSLKPDGQITRGVTGLAGIWVLGAAVLAWSLATLLASSHWHLHGRILLTLGLVASWRYSWALVHLLRALAFLGVMFPRLRRRAAAIDPATSISHVYGVVCSFDIPEEQFRAVYTALVENCLDSAIPATIVASVTSDRDCAILGDVLRTFGNPHSVRIVAQFQQGNGKRSAMAVALRTIARERPDPKSVTLMLDGDVMLQRGVVGECARFLAADPLLAALTTNNDARMGSNDPSRYWYWLRFAQRHLMMSSLALSGKLLVLTGRFSVYRTCHLIEEGCIDAVENDHIEHWLHGRIQLLSGDDKSLWHYLLQRGGRMLYLPHVKAVSLEALPVDTGFVDGSIRLMHRWLGNTVRTNGRALGLGPRRCGPFLWWCLLDQRLSVLSTFFGVGTALFLILFKSLFYLPVYLAWLAVSRGLMSAIYGALWGYYHPSWPIYLFYNQLVGMFLKLYLLFRPDRQYWTRQRIGRNDSTWFRRCLANLLLLATIATMLLGVAAITKLLVSA